MIKKYHNFIADKKSDSIGVEVFEVILALIAKNSEPPQHRMIEIYKLAKIVTKKTTRKLISLIFAQFDKKARNIERFYFEKDAATLMEIERSKEDGKIFHS